MGSRRKLAYVACAAFVAAPGLLLIEPVSMYVPLLMTALGGAGLYLLFTSER